MYLMIDLFEPVICTGLQGSATALVSTVSSSLWTAVLADIGFSSGLGADGTFLRANLAFSLDPHPFAITLMFLHLSYLTQKSNKWTRHMIDRLVQ